jgi:regulation of enolase protein 1 (concanavalin A-like superfamily)
MPEVIVGGSGTQYYLNVNPDGSINIGSMPTISVSSSAGSEVYVKAGSLQVLSSPGSIGVYGALSATVGSEVYVKAGSIQTYNPIGIGSIWFGGGIGSITITNSLPAIGSYTTQTVSGTITIDTLPAVNIAAGSIRLISTTGSSSVYSASALAVSGIVNQGTNPWIISGTVTVDNRVAGSIVNIPDINIIAGSIRLTSTTGSVGVYSASSLAISGIVNQGTSPWAVSGVTNQGTSPWITLGSSYLVSSPGSVGVYGSLTATAGSESYIKGGSILTYNPIGVGSVLVVSSAGSIGVYGSLTATAGSEQYVKAGSVQIYGRSGVDIYPLLVTSGTYARLQVDVNSTPTPVAISGIVNQGTSPWAISGITNQGTNPWIVLGSFARTNTGSVIIATNPVPISGVVNQGTSPWAICPRRCSLGN